MWICRSMYTTTQSITSMLITIMNIATTTKRRGTITTMRLRPITMRWPLIWRTILTYMHTTMITSPIMTTMMSTTSITLIPTRKPIQKRIPATSMDGISHIIEHLNLPDEVKKDVVAVYHLIAEAESHVHGKTVEEIHFHEVGTADAIADIAGVCLLMHMIAPQKTIASPIHVGSGNVRCAHGILPVPAPATAFILQGLPIYSGTIRGELCTPTGAALLKHFVTEFREMPVMRTSAIGYGMGKKDFERANCVRVLLGETEESGDEVAELSCNLDDMTPEALGFVQEILFAAGALEVYTIPIGMKKSRPGILLTCMCRCGDKEKMISLLFKHTTTLGIRENISRRYTLTRTMKEHETPYGVVREKIAEGYGVKRGKLEYEDLAKIAREQGMSLGEVRKIVKNNQ